MTSKAIASTALAPFFIVRVHQAFLYALLIALIPCMGYGQSPPEFQPVPQIDEQAPPRELQVLGPTLAPEEIDRAVLERLLNDIKLDAVNVAETLGISSAALEEVTIILSNARSFINSNELASIRAMCNAWNSSALDGDDRIREALDAYQDRKQFTLNFIQRYYTVVVRDIVALLDSHEAVRFNGYMEDRRRRMANAGATFGRAVTQNVRSGAESVHFHCGTPRT